MNAAADNAKRAHCRKQFKLEIVVQKYITA